MEEGCGWLLLILLIIGIVIAIIYFVILAIAYMLAFLGLSIIIPLDFFGSAFTWIGISSPAVGWLLYGCFIGAVIGLIKGLKKAGRTSDLWKVYLGATILFTLLFFGSYMAYSSEGMWKSEPPPVITNTASTVTQPSIPGTWTGTFSSKPATLVINNGKGNDFYGTLTVDQTRLAVNLTVIPNSQQVIIKEVRVLSKSPDWALGVDTGSFSNDGRNMSGNGKDSRGSTYSWSFTKR